MNRGILNLPLCHSYLESGWDFLFCKKFCTHLSTNFGSEGTNSRKSGKNSHKWKVRCWKNPVISGTGIIIIDGISLVQGEKHYVMAQTNIYTNYQNFQESQKGSEKDSSLPSLNSRLTLLISVLRTNYVTWYKDSSQARVYFKWALLVAHPVLLVSSLPDWCNSIAESSDFIEIRPFVRLLFDWVCSIKTPNDIFHKKIWKMYIVKVA